ncbi:protein AATF [Genypterus blacodes]|uniref:protein AATF n=1 Tax=Genypterus blacodes TaxID=154954 RepID=UPI003F76AD70
MAGSFSQQLEELLNPLPKFADPEDDNDDTTKAKVVDTFDEDDDDEDGVGLSALRKHNASLLSETDRRYTGKTVSRKQLLMDIEGGDDDDEEEEEENEDSLGDQEEDDGDEDGVDLEDDNEELKSNHSVLSSDGPDTKPQVSKSDITFPQDVDFEKLVEGIDNLGEEEDDDDDDDSKDESDESEEEEEGSEDDEMEDANDGEEPVRTFSQDKVDEEVEKGKAVKNQLALWDQLLEGRIKIQKALVSANQLPQPATLPEFKSRGGAELAGALKNSHKALKALQRSLLELQDQMLYQNPDTRPIGLGKTWGAGGETEADEVNSDENETMEDEERPSKEDGPLKRKLDMAEYPDFMAKRFTAFLPYCNTKLQMWHDKTKLIMGKSSKDFVAFDRNILTQVEQVLMDKPRLVRRTQTRRSEYKVLGKKESSVLTPEAAPTEGEEAEQQLKANTHLKDLDEDIFDDDDFYHQLLRELIERRTSAADPNDQVAMGRQWLAIQKLRSKIKKKVDTKASKGRKVRFHIHSKLQNFMAPVDNSTMSDEARSELYCGLFGKNSAVME